MTISRPLRTSLSRFFVVFAFRQIKLRLLPLKETLRAERTYNVTPRLRLQFFTGNARYIASARCNNLNGSAFLDGIDCINRRTCSVSATSVK